MGQFHESLNSRLIEFIQAQPVFFVASAGSGTRVNLSPKGMDTLRVLDERSVAYLDITGSGNETAAHITHDGRLTIMFCGFGDKPLILRLYGRGQVILPSSPKWSELVDRFPDLPGRRQIILLNIESLQTSCGFGVPRMQLIANRTEMSDWASKKGESGLAQYRAAKNTRSIDGLPVPIRDT